MIEYDVIIGTKRYATDTNLLICFIRPFTFRAQTCSSAPLLPSLKQSLEKRTSEKASQQRLHIALEDSSSNMEGTVTLFV